MKKVDITDKLSFEGNPILVVKGKELEVKADAPTMLKVMGLMGNDDSGLNEIIDAYDLMFTDKSKKEIEKLNVDFKDLMIIVENAVSLVIGETETQGE